jgi:hypothetical protein
VLVQYILIVAMISELKIVASKIANAVFGPTNAIVQFYTKHRSRIARNVFQLLMNHPLFARV